ncbi:MAG: SLC13 family permease [Akkermansiaceae bacterium]|jgi:di/tricarboxylate transporter|nr:SLC13 family permease [Akkermansiaceae bacterium]MDP4721413.1 SLC13 family permease [Akkermansiaceae bacterium]MDP4779052.1 SLC13 family permease [Akkermansiaceae bacterium]MDP4846835.1 SLC13 family permease [Akkermansiaceae bacterium]MDP4995789.1 SLC13 family permease [Akkermansiaceae bacterium]
MSLEIALTLLVVGLTLVAFIREWSSPDVLALSILCLLVALGLIDMGEMSSVFRNEAPLTIAALFVIGGALEKSGAIAQIGRLLQKRVNGGVRTSIFAFTVVAAFFSAWMNNTAIVAILMPVVLGFARSKDIAASKLLIPLSYSSILGGCCTLIGTSTNLLVNGSLKDLGLEPMSMFALAPVGVPLAIAGIAYMVIFGPKMLPSRSSITGSLEIDFRTTPLHHLLIGEGSELIGKKLLDTTLGSREAGIHVLEIRRRGTRLMLPLSSVTVEKNDRFLVALHRRKGGAAKAEQLFAEIGAQELSAVDGIVSELVIHSESSLAGRTLAAADFRQKYNCVVLAVHRNGLNITSRMSEVTLDKGDTLLVITAVNNLPALKETRDFVLTDAPDERSSSELVPTPVKKWPIMFSWGVLATVVLTVAITDLLGGMYPAIPQIPIHYAGIVGALALLWTGILTPREAYASVDWQVLLMLYGLLGLGMAMQTSGTAEWLAKNLVSITEAFVSPEMLPYAMLWLVVLFTMVLTEVLSNNATAVMMVPIVVRLSSELGVDSRPFIMGITVAASACFALPMGYQTHMMVYGPGGYRFSDYLRMGIPLNVICWVISCLMIPLIWPF